MRKILGYLVIFIVVISCKERSVYDPNDEVLIVSTIFKEVLDEGPLVPGNNIKIIFDGYLRPLKTEDSNSLKDNDLYLGYDFEKEKEKVQLDIEQITNLGSYILIKSESGNGETAKVYFSRVYFDKNKEKGVFIFEIFCGEYCYEKKIITVKKEESSGDWSVIDTNILWMG